METESCFRQGLEETADEFLRRYRNSHEMIIGEELAKKICIDYLKEECAVVLQTRKELGYFYVVYPQKINAAFDQLFKCCLNTHGLNKVNWLAVGFKSRKDSVVKCHFETAAFEEIFFSPKE